MFGDKSSLHLEIVLVLLLLFILSRAVSVQAERPNWQRKQVDWRMTGNARVKAIHYPTTKPVPIFNEQPRCRTRALRKRIVDTADAQQLALSAQQSAGPVFAAVIDSPPVDGFIPWLVVAITDERLDELELEAIPQISVVGSYLTSNPQADYAVGIFDTGASAHVIGNTAATRAGLFGHVPDLVTSNLVDISGVIDSVAAWVSQPLGLFVDGLGAVDADGLLTDTSGMVGQTNLSIAVGRGGSPDLPTAIGSPLAVYFVADFRNDRVITLSRDGESFAGPDINFYHHDDPCIPTYPNIIPLELRPLGAYSVQYIPTFEGIFEFPPATPSTIIGNLAQSTFFVHSVDLTEGEKSAIDRQRFMLDTGAQITVIGSRIAARLALQPGDCEFEVEIQGVTGKTIMVPGFYIDSLTIPAIGEWLSFTDVPVALLDVSSPEGGTIDGIIGMNLFIDLNFVVRGGGIFLQDDPALEFEHITPGSIADIVPDGGDGAVNAFDLAALLQTWLAVPTSTNWNLRYDIAPRSKPDGIVDFRDFDLLAKYWLQGATP